VESKIIFDNVSKKFSKGYISDSLRDVLTAPFRNLFRRNGSIPADQGDKDFWALKDVSFDVKAGESLGIIGPNGSGKSTTLKLLARILRPDEGKVVVNGRVGALIELGAGFHPDLTGRENVYLNASILGMKKDEVKKKYDEIVDFAELHKFMETPVKWFSSGMYARLGFSVAVNINPQVLLIDEVLSVGDYLFRDKCVEKMKKFTDSGVTMVVVSHDRHMIERLCQKGVLLNNGEIRESGDIKNVIDAYYSNFREKNHTDIQSGSGGVSAEREDKNTPIEITGVKVMDVENNHSDTFLASEGMKVQIHYRANEKIQNPCFYSRILTPKFQTNKGDAVLHGTNTERFNLELDCQPGDEGIVEINYNQLNLLSGKYYLNVGIMPNFFSSNIYDRLNKAAVLTVSSDIEKGTGVVFIDHHWTLSNKKKSNILE